MKLLSTKRYNVIAVFVVLIVFMAILLGDGYYSWQVQKVELEHDAQNSAAYVEESLNQVVSLLQAVGSNKILQSGDTKKIAAFLTSLGEFPQIENFALASAEGVCWTGTDECKAQASLANMEFFREVLKTGKPHVSSATKKEDHLVFYVASPLFDENNQMSYVFYAIISSDRLQSTVSKIRLGTNGIIHIVDKYNNLLLAEKNVTDLTTCNLIYKQQDNLWENIKHFNVSGEASIGATGWKLVVHKNLYAMLKDVAQRMFWDVFFIFLVLFPVVAAFYVFVGQLTRQKLDLLKSNAKLKKLAVTDGLTGLLNHRAFHESLAKKLANAGDAPVSLLIIDLDNFKIFNDKYGHQVGDHVLKHIATILIGFFKPKGVVARYGGDEFTVILPATGYEKALVMAQKLLDFITSASLQISEDREENIRVSIGVATYPKDAKDRDNLIRHADEALFRAKEQESNKVQMYYSVIEELRQSLQGDQDLIKTIYTLNTVINAKDKYTYGHSERVMHYAAELARWMGLGKEDIENITIGALLHDIGKIEIGGDILNKPGQLTSAEFDSIKKHPLVGADIIKPLKTMEKAYPFVLYHHERFDGMGYPFGLSGHEIPLYGRIAAVADSFDAMTTNRPYKKGMTAMEALEELQRCAGTQFDPEIVEKFIEMYTGEAKGKIHVSNEPLIS